MMITKQDLKEHYACMKAEPFYKETLEDINHMYQNCLKWYHGDKERSAKEAVHFEYYDDGDLIRASDPDRTQIVLAMARFLFDHDFPADFLNDQMKQDLNHILSEDKVTKYKEFYYPDDFVQMSADVNNIRAWLQNQ